MIERIARAMANAPGVDRKDWYLWVPAAERAWEEVKAAADADLQTFIMSVLDKQDRRTARPAIEIVPTATHEKL